mmetsp:Transcript_7123/g.14063  ORF Transcript_7123/g.14063 Transcript_7123/m.14063 type:complete len:82 (+) Transcript_7123:876-1121(+)|eukprot:scaffold2069_cov187-Amphora_coffeaeformis.AAC.31
MVKKDKLSNNKQNLYEACASTDPTTFVEFFWHGLSLKELDRTGDEIANSQNNAHQLEKLKRDWKSSMAYSERKPIQSGEMR